MSFPKLSRKNLPTKLGLMLVLVPVVHLSAQTGTVQTTQGAPAAGGQTQNTGSEGAGGAVPAATGLDTNTEMSENPPLTGLDEPKFERAVIERSYIVPRAEVSESANSNFPGVFSSRSWSEVTQAYGSVDLQKLWKVHPLDVSYTAGFNAYRGVGSNIFLLQTLSLTQRFLWRTGQFAVRDSFSYLPQGSFGFGSYGGLGGFTGGGSLGGGGVTGGFGTPGFTTTLFGNIGLQPRILNVTNADITQYLSPRSSVVLAGGYGFTEFLGKPQASTLCAAALSCFLNSNQSIGQVGYNYQISHRNQVGVSYAYEQFHFPGITAGSINANLWQVVLGHRISGKLDLRLGGGPELVRTNETELFPILPGIAVPITLAGKFLSASAQVDLFYRASARSSFSASYWRYINAGSGLFGGASTDQIRVGLNRALNRTWNLLVETGYARNSRLLTANNTSVAGSAATFQTWYANGAMRRQLNREFGLFVSYQFNAFTFGSGYCQTVGCANSYGRQIALIGIDWTPKPFRLD